LSAISRPLREAPEPCTEGGGGTTALPEFPIGIFANARCAPTGNCGAGATTCTCPILISLSLRVAASATSGVGSTTAGCGACIFRLDIAELTSGAGATTDAGIVGSLKSEGEAAIAAVGIVGIGRPMATTLGKGTS
jgi:hypothetical protein